VLVGAVGGLTAWAAVAIGRTTPARALDPNDVVLGQVNTASATTTIRNPNTTDVALTGAGATAGGVSGTSIESYGVAGRSKEGYGVTGFSESRAGVFGEGDATPGVRGTSDSGFGVDAFSLKGTAVHAHTPHGKAAVWAEIDNRSGSYPAVLGASSSSGPGVAGAWSNDVEPARPGLPVPKETGVYGVASGLEGSPLPGGTGVHGFAPEGRGVFGRSTTGQGVRGASVSGTAGAFESTAGYALSTAGRVRFTKVSGVAALAAGTSSKTVTPGVDLTTASFVLLTPRGNLGGRGLWYTVDHSANRFTIRVSSPVTTSVGIGWLVLG
jgi:hypothetical protein